MAASIADSETSPTVTALLTSRLPGRCAGLKVRLKYLIMRSFREHASLTAQLIQKNSSAAVGAAGARLELIRSELRARPLDRARCKQDCLGLYRFSEGFFSSGRNGCSTRRGAGALQRGAARCSACADSGVKGGRLCVSNTRSVCGGSIGPAFVPPSLRLLGRRDRPARSISVSRRARQRAHRIAVPVNWLGEPLSGPAFRSDGPCVLVAEEMHHFDVQHRSGLAVEIARYELQSRHAVVDHAQ